jgi:hypothetical protein
VRKLLLFPVLLVAAFVIAGLYGALHNQISYSVAPDYFHGHKFVQFHIPLGMQNRIGASVVGWHASWWMGLLIGVPVLLVGLNLPPDRYAGRCLAAFAVVAGTALCVGLAALAYAAAREDAAFDRALAMHNFSYLGGAVGVLTASAYLVIERVRLG